MSFFVSIVLLLQLIGISSLAEGLSNDCPPSWCGGQEIKLPFTLESSPESCGNGEILKLSCSSRNETILTLPSSETYQVINIDYYGAELRVALSSSINCPWMNSYLPNTNGSAYFLEEWKYVLLNCTQKLPSKTHNNIIIGPISCLGETGGFVYAMESWMPLSYFSPHCLVKSSVRLPQFDGIDIYSADYGNFILSSIERPKVVLYWNDDSNNMSRTCLLCEFDSKDCGFNKETNNTFCIPRHHKSYIPGVIVGAVLLVLLIPASVLLLCSYRKHRKKKKTRLKVEQFLATYKSTKLSRYSFADIKKMTGRFKHKLGQGGFGSVYKGELSNGIPVAVKMLESSTSNGEEFVNEVSTIGKIHHVHIVRLLGFCSQGTNRALVYEFMPNESLEKFIFMDEPKRKHHQFSMEKLQEIALGIAQGIEYLHQGCNQRILHFDIKPHNILLDYDFNPKISDFGLAKLCSKDQSIVTISAARGTMGYMAPEVYSRNFGSVSHKSDVYSFGVLLLEMIGKRRNVDPTMENHSEMYFPEWVYNKLMEGRSLGLGMGMEMDCTEEIIRKLAVIALWCIQWNPADRPSMTQAVQMLMRDFNSLDIPPRPFVPSSDLQDDI